MKTKMLKREEAEHQWYVIDVAGKVLGRAATEIATLIMGKNRPNYTRHVDSGAGVIVINCDKIRITGNKSSSKVYKRFSGYPGGQKEVVYERMFAKDPAYVVRHAVMGMIPKNKLNLRMMRRLKVYTGEAHPHEAQKPKEKKI